MRQLSNIDYSQAHPKVLSTRGRERVARQIYMVLKKAEPQLAFKSAVCLDVGSSGGSIAHFFLEFVERVACIDTDEQAILLGKKKFGRAITFSTFDGTHIPFKDESFDIVIFRRVYGSVEKVEELVGEIYRVLKLGGLCYFEGHNRLFPLESDYKLPFLPWLPPRFAASLVSISGHKKYYIGRYKTYWGLKKLFSHFAIIMLTSEIIKNPQKFGFSRLYKYSWFTKRSSLSILKLFEPLYPDFIWVLKKG